SSLRSWPAQNAGPLAASTTTRTERSAAIAASASVSAASNSSERLLRAWGRLRVSTATSPTSSRSKTGAAGAGSARAAEVCAFIERSLCQASRSLYPNRNEDGRAGHNDERGEA